MTDNTPKAWLCMVCGYVHRQDAAPDECPVCGSPEEYFEAHAEHVETVSPAKTTRWRCLVCSLEHSGEHPPDKCPVCASSAERFESIAEKTEEPVFDSGDREHIVITGAGIAGLSAVESIRSISKNAKITLISRERHLPYFRLNLTRLLAGEISEDALLLHPESWYTDNGIDLVLNSDVSKISLDIQKLHLVNGSSYSYDKLILTAGAHSFMPPVPGANRDGVTTLRSLDDARFIIDKADNADSIVIIGGGVLGLEVAGALAKRSKNVTLLESFGWLMPRQLNEKAAKLLSRHVLALGINLKTGVFVDELAGDENVAEVILKNGEIIPADLVVMTAGVRPNSYLARLAGLRVDKGIIVDDFMQTSNMNVYAAGDMAEHRGMLYGMWNAALYQGKIAGMNAVGKPMEFGGIPRSHSIKVLGVDLMSIGIFEPEDGSYIVIEEESGDSYTCFIFRDTHIAGSILFGNTAVSGEVKKAIEKQTDMSGLLKSKPSVNDVLEFFASR